MVVAEVAAVAATLATARDAATAAVAAINITTTINNQGAMHPVFFTPFL